MKQKSVVTRAVCALMAFCFVFCVCVNQDIAYAVDSHYDSGYGNMSSAQKQAYLTQHLKEVTDKLTSLSRQSEETQEYIDTLDEKIKYLQLELELAQDNMDSAKKRISTLEKKYKSNEDEIAQLKLDIDKLSEDSRLLQSKFDISYKEYSQRAKAMYISGEMNTLSALLTCDDLSSLFTRLEMIRRVSKSDRELLESIRSEGEELLETKALLEDKNQDLNSDQEELKSTRLELKQTVTQLEAKQADYENKELAYEQEKSRSDKLLLDLHEKTKTFSEFKNQDQRELAEVNADIEAAAEAHRKKMEELEKATSTTTTKPTTTHRKPSTTVDSGDASSGNDSTHSTTKKPTTSKKTTTTASNKLKMTFPVPSQKRITTGYGSAGYAGHTGVDFACDTGSKVVAAESGYVIISTDLKNSNGSYRSYGRYIVIAHDKKNSKGDYVYTLYAHNSKRVVSEGDYVTKGQLIAYSGSTGNSTGPHCHFEVRTPTASYDDCVDPTRYLP